MIKHWRRSAALKAMPLIDPNAVRTPWGEFGGVFAASGRRWSPVCWCCC